MPTQLAIMKGTPEFVLFKDFSGSGQSQSHMSDGMAIKKSHGRQLFATS